MHDAGGILNVACTWGDLPAPTVDVTDLAISDHRMLQWSSNLCRPPPVYETRVSRPWRSFDPDTFRADLESSALYNERRYMNMDGDSLAALYDSTITGLLDQQVLARVTTCHRRPSSLWFEDECRQAKRALRSQGKVLRCAGLLLDNTSSVAAA